MKKVKKISLRTVTDRMSENEMKKVVGGYGDYGGYGGGYGDYGDSGSILCGNDNCHGACPIRIVWDNKKKNYITIAEKCYKFAENCFCMPIS